MTRFRYSVKTLLLVVMNVVLLIGTLPALGARSPDAILRQGCLNFCTLLFSLMCSRMGQTVARTLLFNAIFYGWGVVCILGDRFDIGVPLRLLLALLGPAFALWVWLDPLPLVGPIVRGEPSKQ